MVGLVYHSGYHSVEIAVARAQSIIDTVSVPKHEASRDLIAATDLLLQRTSLSLAACSFLAGHCGPAPFTTLRVSLATLNGLAYATGLPLVGVDGLRAFVEQERERCTTPYLVVLLNAFCQDVYFAVYHRAGATLETGCMPIGAFLDKLTTILDTSGHPVPQVTCVGNGVLLHQSALVSRFGQRMSVPQPLPDLCSLSALYAQAHYLWSSGQTTSYLLPIYLKESSTPLCPARKPTCL